METTAKLAIPLPMQELEAFCKKWHIVKLSVFGSVLREDFDEKSDIDFLVDFAPGLAPGIFAHIRMQDEATELLGRPVDIVDAAAIAASENWIRRKAILNSARVIFGAAA